MYIENRMKKKWKNKNKNWNWERKSTLIPLGSRNRCVQMTNAFRIHVILIFFCLVAILLLFYRHLSRHSPSVDLSETIERIRAQCLMAEKVLLRIKEWIFFLPILSIHFLVTSNLGRLFESPVWWTLIYCHLFSEREIKWAQTQEYGNTAKRMLNK